MKSTRIALIFLLLIGMVLTMTFTAHAGSGSEVSVPGSVLTIDPNASGTKLTGPLTIHYDIFDAPRCYSYGAPYSSNMYYFVRLRKGSILYAFSGVKENICVGDIASQETAFRSFIGSTIVPNIFPDNPTAPFALKSVDQIKDDNQVLFPGSPWFVIMDIELAVKN